ncbi:MAG TPA: hypothetical protein VJI67_00080 [archaeon]|nr:hypothetical protein [archaeon]HLD81423.1 hypothetical protein [archaeon]
MNEKPKKSLLAWLKDSYMELFKPVGDAVNFVLLLLVYVFVVGPVALLAKLSGKKFMRENHPGMTYWVDREPLPDNKDSLRKYLRRQF